MIDEFKIWTMQHLFIVISTTKYHSSEEFCECEAFLQTSLRTSLVSLFVYLFDLIGLSYLLLFFCAGFVLD